jgi:hypothetical protein
VKRVPDRKHRSILKGAPCRCPATTAWRSRCGGGRHQKLLRQRRCGEIRRFPGNGLQGSFSGIHPRSGTPRGSDDTSGRSGNDREARCAEPAKARRRNGSRGCDLRRGRGHRHLRLRSAGAAPTGGDAASLDRLVSAVTKAILAKRPAPGRCGGYGATRSRSSVARDDKRPLGFERQRRQVHANVEPRPISLRTSTRPPGASTIRRVADKPKPTPGMFISRA